VSHKRPPVPSWSRSKFSIVQYSLHLLIILIFQLMCEESGSACKAIAPPMSLTASSRWHQPHRSWSSSFRILIQVTWSATQVYCGPRRRDTRNCQNIK